jgi:energy-converting hydrogenase A subunit M
MNVETLDRSAAYVAAKSALDVVQRVTGGWPTEVAEPAQRCARDMVASIAESLEHGEISPARRRCLRGAILNAIELAAICDIARAHGLGSEDSLRSAGRALSLLGLSYHATSLGDG